MSAQTSSASEREGSILDRLRLDGRVALVVGAGGGGMGTQTAAALAQAGARVAAADVAAEPLAATVELIERQGGTCLPLTGDSRSSAAVDELVERASAELGPVDLLVNVVGGTQAGQWSRLETTSDEIFDAVVELNLRAMFLTCRRVAARLIEDGRTGSIVNFSSVSGLAGAPFHGPYGAAKAGVIALTRTMALEWGPRGIRVNAVVPGSVRTPRTASQKPMDRPSTWNPLGRKAEADEVSAAVLFLLSDLASGITGQALNVDAGVTTRSPFGSTEMFEPRLGS